MLPALKSEDQALLDQSIAYDWSMPEYKIRQFVGGSHIHPLHKIKQYMMELNTRQESLQVFVDEVEEFQLLIDLENEKKEVAQFEAEKKLCDLEINKLRRKLEVTKEKVRASIAERDKFLRVIHEFNNSEEAYAADGRKYLDILKNDPEGVEQIESDYWEYRLAKQAALDFIAYGRIGVGNMEAIMQLDADQQNKTLAMAYETLIKNEKRMAVVSDAVHARIQNGQEISDITKLLNIGNSEFLQNLQLEQDKPDVPLIQKR